MSSQTSKKVPILSISKIWVQIMALCLNVLLEAVSAGQALRSARNMCPKLKPNYRNVS